MVNINLTTVNDQREKEASYAKGIVAIVIALVVLLAAYGAIFFLNSGVVAKIAATNAEYANEYKKLTGGNNSIVMDFQNRLLIAKDQVADKNDALASLQDMEKTLVPGIYLTSYKFDESKKSVSIGGVADNFDLVAKQILSFKKNESVSDVLEGKSTLAEGGKVKFDMEVKFK